MSDLSNRSLESLNTKNCYENMDLRETGLFYNFYELVEGYMVIKNYSYYYYLSMDR